MSEAVTFGESLSRPESAELRAFVAGSLAGRPPGRLHVDTVPALDARLRRGEMPEPASCSYLLLDLQRLILYTETPSPEPGGSRLGSLIRSLTDGYAVQHSPLFLEHAVEPFRFLYPPAVLRVLPLLWPLLRPGFLVSADFASGEISIEAARAHPATAGDDTAGITPPPSLTLDDRWTDASLREAPPVEVLDLVSAVVGVVRGKQDSVDVASLPFTTTRITWEGGQMAEFCFGKAPRPADASRVAVYEALERFHVVSCPSGERLLHGTFDEVRSEALDPRALFFGRMRFPSGEVVLPFSNDAPLYWTWAHMLGGRPVLVPAQEVWFGTGGLPDETLFATATTSGCALGRSVEEAAVFGLLELVERDGFLTTWYLRRPCARIDPNSVADESFQLLRRRWNAAFPRYGFYLFDATTDVGVPTVLAVAVRERGEGPYTFHAAAARLSVPAACRAALKDLAGFIPRLPGQKRDELRQFLRDPQRTRRPEDHFGIYALEEAFERLEFLDFGTGPGMDARDAGAGNPVPERDRYNLCQLLETMAGHLGTIGICVLLKDLTHSGLRDRLRCVRVIAPGLYPIWFGAGALRFAVTERLQRLARTYTGRIVDNAADCNLEIHPFA